MSKVGMYKKHFSFHKHSFFKVLGLENFGVVTRSVVEVDEILGLVWLGLLLFRCLV